MLKTLIEIFGLYILYKVVFEFMIPLFQATKHVKDKVGDMQRNMREQMNQQNNHHQNTPKPTPPPKKDEEYIDYEEVK